MASGDEAQAAIDKLDALVSLFFYVVLIKFAIMFFNSWELHFQLYFVFVNCYICVLRRSNFSLMIWILSCFVFSNRKMVLMGFTDGVNERNLYRSPKLCDSFTHVVYFWMVLCQLYCHLFGHRNLVFLCYYAFGLSTWNFSIALSLDSWIASYQTESEYESHKVQ